VIPIEVNPEWNIITRTILPVISQPAMFPGDDRTNGIGDMVVTAFLSPAVPKGLIWGVGPVLQLPTDSNGLGNKNWGLGASFVVLKLEKGDPWVYGALVNNIWSLTSDQTGGVLQQRVDPALRQLQLSQRLLPDQLAPIITVNWKAASGQQWTVPLGGGVGKIFHFGKLPVNAHDRGLLQRRQARLRTQLAGPRASAAHVPEVRPGRPRRGLGCCFTHRTPDHACLPPRPSW
jgi:hypothetical protein